MYITNKIKGLKMDEERRGLYGAIFAKLDESSIDDIHDLVEILYEKELKLDDTIRTRH